MGVLLCPRRSAQGNRIPAVKAPILVVVRKDTNPERWVTLIEFTKVVVVLERMAPIHNSEFIAVSVAGTLSTRQQDCEHDGNPKTGVLPPVRNTGFGVC